MRKCPIFHRHCEPVTDVTGVAIRSPFSTHCIICKTLWGADCHVAQVLLAMTSKDRRHYRDLSTRTPRALPAAMLKPRLRGAARRAHGSSAEHAMRDLIASNAPLRNGMHKARPAYTKTLTPGDSRGSQSPWHAFLLYLSPCSERWSPRRALVA